MSRPDVERKKTDKKWIDFDVEWKVLLGSDDVDNNDVDDADGDANWLLTDGESYAKFWRQETKKPGFEFVHKNQFEKVRSSLNYLLF